MKTKAKPKSNAKEKDMGRFSIEIELANYKDVVLAQSGHLDAADVRRVRIQGVVDSGAARLVLPESAAKELGLTVTGQVKVRYADRRTGRRPQVEGVYLTLLGRHSVFNATLEPKRDTALIGAIVLEDLDFLVDCTRQRIYPRDPDFVVSEIE
jgi:predicted aspartyl protease